MATLFLQTAGASLGQAIGGPIGALAGRALGTYVGSTIDAALFQRSKTPSASSSRLTNLAGLMATEGGFIPRIYGRARVGGQLIWTTRFDEQATLVRSGRSGGKGGSLSSSSTASQSSSTISYSYFGNFAIAMCEGPISFVRRIWADGQELDLSLYTYRVYLGGDHQTADALIASKEGVENTPCYNGIAYVVFEQFPLAQFGNRIPQFSFEVIRSINGLAPHIQSIHVIPAATEYGYSTQALVQNLGQGVSQSENRHLVASTTDWQASLDALQALCPNLKYVSLVVAWFGDDLRADCCSILPRVENNIKSIPAMPWSVAGFSRSTAPLISQIDNHSAFGGTPSDQAVIQALVDLSTRGLAVTFYPFIMMDIASDNQLLDPLSAKAGQPAYPWRGLIAPSTSSSLSISDQISHFFNGPSDNGSFSSFILHYAQLCSSYNIDTFILGSELVSLSHAQAQDGSYPFAVQLLALLKEVRAIVGPHVNLSYGADWTEYGACVSHNGTQIDFPLDLFWSDSDVNFIGIDVYWPLSDWRDGASHADAQQASSIYDQSYLACKFASGEAYDFYYASDHDRQMQTRSPITDGAYQKPWIFRPKDIQGWWSNQHICRIANQETAVSPWIACSKPIWFLEFGCPAVDRGSNAPNAFPDEKSTQSQLPYFSRGFRDDLIQKRSLQACYDFYSPSSPDFAPTHNPISPLYHDYMLDTSRIYLWAWDARPFPSFPLLTSVWSDGVNWANGHWLTGRLEAMDTDDLLAQLLSDFDAHYLPIKINTHGFLDGFIIDKLSSLRNLIDPLSTLFSFDVCFTSGHLRFHHRQHKSVATIDINDCVIDQQPDAIEQQSAQAADLPHTLTLNVSDSTYDYRPISVLAQYPLAASKRDSMADIAVMTYRAHAKQLADIWLNDLWAGRHVFTFKLSYRHYHLEIGDTITLLFRGMTYLAHIERIEDGLFRTIEARSINPDIYNYRAYDEQPITYAAPSLPGPPHYCVLDLAIAPSSPISLQYLAVYADPWVSSFSLYRQNGQSFELAQIIAQPSNIGTLLTPLPSGPTDIFDRASIFTVQCPFALSSVSSLDVLNGKNLAAIRGDDGAWEIIAFAHAELIAPQTYKLSNLLRGLGGQNYLADRVTPAGSCFVLLDQSIVNLLSGVSNLGVAQTWRLGPSSRDYGDQSYVQFSTTPTSLALKPFAPCHLTATKVNNDIIISFKRRGRIDADGWEALDIPLGEDTMAFELDIIKAGQIIRTLSSTSQEFVYSFAQQQIDFSSQLNAVDVSLYQISASVGRGFAAQAHFSFT
jgi:GTA TIM-barrel-like domain/Putative phage tail protein